MYFLLSKIWINNQHDYNFNNIEDDVKQINDYGMKGIKTYIKMNSREQYDKLIKGLI